MENEMKFEYRYARTDSIESIIYIEYIDSQPHSVITSNENGGLTTFDFNKDCKECELFMYFNSGGGGRMNDLQAPHFVENASANYWIHPLASFRDGKMPINCQKLEHPILYNDNPNVFENGRQIFDEVYCKFCEKWYDEDNCSDHHIWDDEECLLIYFDGTDLEN